MVAAIPPSEKLSEIFEVIQEVWLLPLLYCSALLPQFILIAPHMDLPLLNILCFLKYIITSFRCTMIFDVHYTNESQAHKNFET